MRGRNKENPSDRTSGIELEQRLEPQSDGICNTLTSVQKDNLVLESECLGGFGDKKSNGGTQYFQHYRVYSMGDVALCIPSQLPGGSYNYLEKKQIIFDDYNSTIPEDQSVSPTLTTNCGASALRNGVKMIKVRQATKDGFALCELGGVVDLDYPSSETRRGRVIENGQISPTLTTENIPSVIELGNPEFYNFLYEIDGEIYLIRIRKLMPLECWRLMGFTDEDFHKAEQVVSNTQLYKQAGNSIVVNCLEGIFRGLIE